jgi:hypothetical protein
MGRYCIIFNLLSGVLMMEFTSVLRKGVTLRKQAAGRMAGGPLALALKEMANNKPQVRINSVQHEESKFLPVSPVGRDLSIAVNNLNFWVLFVNTQGSGIAPWGKLIILDADFEGQGQVKSPFRIGMVAHELTHLLQREINQIHYWPRGGFNPIRGRRWLGDSTNYMEFLAYLVGWTVEYDFTLATQLDPNISQDQREKNNQALEKICQRLARLTAAGSQELSRMITELFPNNPIYKQNFKTENQYPDLRIPPGPWHYWLRQLGFSRSSVDHIMILAAQG